MRSKKRTLIKACARKSKKYLKAEFSFLARKFKHLKGTESKSPCFLNIATVVSKATVLVSKPELPLAESWFIQLSKKWKNERKWSKAKREEEDQESNSKFLLAALWVQTWSPLHTVTKSQILSKNFKKNEMTFSSRKSKQFVNYWHENSNSQFWMFLKIDFLDTIWDFLTVCAHKYY